MAGDLILVVEDNTLLLEGIRDLLEVSGYRGEKGSGAFS